MDASLNRYEIFIKVVELGNISRAAEALHYTQSGVSHAVAALEKEAGFTIFVRSSKGVTLTRNGIRLVEPIRNLVNQQRILAQSIADINNVVAGTIHIGTFASPSAQWLPKIMRAFQAMYPLVDFELLTGNYDEITEWIRQGKIDCGFLSAPASDGLSFLSLKKDPMLILLPTDHPLATKEKLSLNDIIKEPFIIPAKGCDNDIQEVLRFVWNEINISYALSDDISVMAMVENGFGISILPELLLRSFTFNLALRPLAPPRYRNIGIASLSMKSVSIVTKVFIEYLGGLDISKFES
jgi:DNA-binding transcriptional LysR family regulator